MVLETKIADTGTTPARPDIRTALAILVCMSAIYFFSFFQRVAIPGTIFDELQSSFKITASLVTGLSSLYLYIYGGMQFIAGPLNDRFGAARVMLACGVLLTLGSILFPLSPSIGWLYAARALVGLGASLAFISLIKELSYLFTSKQFPVYLGIALVLGYAGGLVGTFPFGHAVIRWGWREPLLIAGVLCAVSLLVALVLFKRTGMLARRVNAPSPLIYGAILRNRASLPLLLAMPVNFAVYFLLQSTLGKKFLIDYCGITAEKATACTFVMMLCMMTAALASGFLTRALGNRRKPLIILAIVFAFTGYCCLLWGLLRGLSGGWFLFCYILLGLSNLGSPISNILMIELNPPEAVGTAAGLLNGLNYVVLAVFTSLSGFVMDRFSAGAHVTATATTYPAQAYLAVLLICACASLGSLICAFFVRETFGRLCNSATPPRSCG